MAQPASSYLPSGLHDGDVFRLIFVTNEGFLCVDEGLPQIDTYNNFVQGQWAASYIRPVIEQYLGVSITFKCIASTHDDSAKDNIESLPTPDDFKGVYKLNGSKIVNTTNNLWTPPLHNPIDLNQTGTPLPLPLPHTNNVWTGTDVDGNSDGFLGQDCHNCINVGSSSEKTDHWINATKEDSCPGGIPANTFTPYQII